MNSILVDRVAPESRENLTLFPLIYGEVGIGENTMGNKLKQGKRYIIKDVQKYFNEQDCKLLSKEYKNNRTQLDYICKCGNKSRITFDSFIQGSRCKKCGIEKAHNKTKLNIDVIKKEFERANCLLLTSTYKNSKTKLDYVCSNGHKTKITWNDFKSGRRCIKCRNEKTGDRRRLSFNYIKNEFEKEDCELLSTKYKGSETLLDYICECGEISKITWGNFQQGVRCNKCGIEKVAEKRRLPFADVKNGSEANGCVLLSTEYINANTVLDYICECGNIAQSTWSNFQKRPGCSICSIKRSRGELKIEKILDSKKIKYISEYRIDDCRDKRTIPFDFAIKNDSFLLGLIEYDGRQHFEPIEFFGGETSLKIAQRHDKIKTDYCIENNIDLLRIPCTEFNNIDSILGEFLMKIEVI